MNFKLVFFLLIRYIWEGKVEEDVEVLMVSNILVK